jgi:hypothetical protein
MTGDILDPYVFPPLIWASPSLHALTTRIGNGVRGGFLGIIDRDPIVLSHINRVTVIGEIFGHNQLRSKCLQVQQVTC